MTRKMPLHLFQWLCVNIKEKIMSKPLIWRKKSLYFKYKKMNNCRLCLVLILALMKVNFTVIDGYRLFVINRLIQDSFIGDVQYIYIHDTTMHRFRFTPNLNSPKPLYSRSRNDADSESRNSTLIDSNSNTVGSWDPYMAEKLDFDECYYSVLEVAVDATNRDLKKGFRHMVKKYHPDNKDTQQERKPTGAFNRSNRSIHKS